MIDNTYLAPALVGVVTGFVTAIALMQVPLLRKIALTVAAISILFAYFHGGLAELIHDAAFLLRHLGRERPFWIGVLGGKLMAALIFAPRRRT
jgi:hypothetical protein